MNKESILFGIIGLLVGLVVGFLFTNSINRGTIAPTSVAVDAQTNLPPDHPPIPGNSDGGAPLPEVQAAIETAKQNPSNFDAQVKAAELYYQIQRFDQAIEFFKKANDLQPGRYEVLVQLGNVAFDADRYEEAEKWYTAALAKKGDDTDARTDLGLTFMFRPVPNYDRAIREFQKVLEKSPDHILALQNLTVAYTRKADVANAKATLARLEKIDPSNSNISNLREDISSVGNK
jgi:tetratricopeptide (TPR) repeat protein